jgi:hypothetical protein
MTPVFGEFLAPATEHIAAATSFRDHLPYAVQCDTVFQLDRLAAVILRYLTDLPLPDALEPTQNPQRNPAARTSTAIVALGQARDIFHPVASAVNAQPNSTGSPRPGRPR